MKKIIALIVLALLFAIAACKAQTNALSVPNFLNQAATWATSYDTNKSWDAVSLQFENGLNQTTGLGASDYLRVQKNIKLWNVTAEGDFFGIGSTFNAVEIGGGYALVSKFDFKLEGNVLIGGTRVDAANGNSNFKFKAEPELRITKLMTFNTYSTASLSLPWIEGQKFTGVPAFRVAVGFTF